MTLSSRPWQSAPAVDTMIVHPHAYQIDNDSQIRYTVLAVLFNDADLQLG